MAPSTSKNGAKFEFPTKPPEETKCQAFKKCFYNPDEGSYLGRTPKNWCQLLLFYSIFYIVLAAMFAICMQGLFATLSDDRPKWVLEDSLIGVNPGMGFRPISERTEEGSLIWYDAKNQTQIKRWVGLVNKFMEPYHKAGSEPGPNQVVCNFDKPPSAGKVCAPNIEAWSSCTRELGYGYNNSAPCIILKLNKIFSWVPEYYDDVTDLPSEMPKHLVDHITKLSPSQRKQIWVSCNGENPADRESVGPISYDPDMGFPSFFYPFTNQPNYLSPIVAVSLQRPQRNRLINIECRAWAKNMQYHGGNKDRKGSVHMEVMID